MKPSIVKKRLSAYQEQLVVAESVLSRMEDSLYLLLEARRERRQSVDLVNVAAKAKRFDRQCDTVLFLQNIIGLLKMAARKPLTESQMDRLFYNLAKFQPQPDGQPDYEYAMRALLSYY